MHQPLELSVQILNILAKNHNKYYTLEELTSIIFSSNSSYELLDIKALERENQARVLDALLLLENQDLITLDSLTDVSQMKIKGLIPRKKITYKLILYFNLFYISLIMCYLHYIMNY